MPTLSITVEPVPGSDINDVFMEASLFAWRAELAWVAFNFNGDHCAAYPDGRGHVMRGCSTVGTWTREKGIQWQ